MAAISRSKAQHFEVMFVGRELTWGEFHDALVIGLAELDKRADRSTDEWEQLEVLALKPEDAHIA